MAKNPKILKEADCIEIKQSYVKATAGHLRTFTPGEIYTVTDVIRGKRGTANHYIVKCIYSPENKDAVGRVDEISKNCPVFGNFNVLPVYWVVETKSVSSDRTYHVFTKASDAKMEYREQYARTADACECDEDEEPEYDMEWVEEPMPYSVSEVLGLGDDWDDYSFGDEKTEIFFKQLHA